MADPVVTDKFAVNTGFKESDADDRGWILYSEKRPDGVYKHRVPVCKWAEYEKENGF